MALEMIFRGATVVSPTGRRQADVGVENGKIVVVGDCSSLRAREEINAEAQLLLPGLIDPHVHLRTPGGTHKEDFYTGTLAAASGGVTTVLDMPNTSPPTTTRARLAEKRALVSGLSVVDFGLYLGATHDNHAELRAAEEDETPFVGIKIFMGASTGELLVSDPDALEAHFVHTRRLVAVHAEDEQILKVTAEVAREHHLTRTHAELRPPAAAVKAVATAVELALKHACPLHICHVSTEVELALLQAISPQLVSCEASPHHLLLNETLEETLGHYVKVNPPLRAESDRLALWEAVRSGRVEVLGTDHAPHLKAEKEQDYGRAPSGIPHLDTSYRSMMWAVQQGWLSLEKLVALGSANPARIFGLMSKGQIAEGFDADLILVDAGEAQVLTEAGLYTRCGWSPFLGWKLPPKPAGVWVRGVQVAAFGKVIRPEHRGREVQAQALPPRSDEASQS
ncbi:MAG: dihydroorotase [Myxococcota bacterium]